MFLSIWSAGGRGWGGRGGEGKGDGMGWLGVLEMGRARGMGVAEWGFLANWVMIQGTTCSNIVLCW